MTDPRAGDDLANGRALAPEQFLHELGALAHAHDAATPDALTRAVDEGRASREAVRRLALEWYVVAKWTAPELPVLIANTPDPYSFTMEHSVHYRHWAQVFADRAGYLGGPHQVETAVAWCRHLGLSDDAIREYVPLPETIAMACTFLFYVRRSYEEGVAVVAFAGERAMAGPDGARSLHDALARHYGLPPAPVTERVVPAGEAARLLGLVATTAGVQARCREAVRNVLLTVACRLQATNRWVG